MTLPRNASGRPWRVRKQLPVRAPSTSRPSTTVTGMASSVRSSTRPRFGRVLLVTAGLVALAACSDDDGDTSERAPTTTIEAVDDTSDAPAATTDTTAATDPDTTTATSEPTAADPVTYTIPPIEPGVDIVDVEGAETDDLGFTDHVQLIRHGAELGVWTESEGAVAVLRAQLGEIDRSNVGGFDLVETRSRSSLLRFAAELADDGATPPVDRDELERLLDALVPTEDAIAETLALDAGVTIDPAVDATEDATDGATADTTGADDGPTGFRRATTATGDRVAQADADCASPRLELYAAEFVEVDCWKIRKRTIDGPHGASELAVLYPDTHETQADATLEALERTVRAGHAWSDATTETFALISPDPIPEGTAIDGQEGLDGADVWGLATDIGSYCFVSLFPASDSAEWDDSYKQMVAHEQIHCLQFADYGNPAGGNVDWYIEGGAEYFSHLVYPNGGNERSHIASFITSSLTQPLHSLSYDAWPWWQFLGNRTSPGAVFDLHGRMKRGSAVDVLAGEPGMADAFQTFTIDLATVGIPTASAPIEPSGKALPHGTISSTGERSEEVERFVAARVAVIYEQERLFEQTDTTSTDGLMQMAEIPERLDRSRWLGLPPEIRSSCGSDTTYIMALTTITPEQHVVEWSVDVADEYDCDPCLGGTWVLDNASFVAVIQSLVAAEGGLPPEAGNISWNIVGPYYIRFDADGSGTSWREDWQMVFGGSMQGVSANVVTTISSIETFDYGADGERFEAWNAVTVDSRATVEVDGLPVSATATPDSVTASVFGNTTTVANESGDDGPQRAGGDYTCDEARLVIALDEAPGSPIAWDRVDDIPEPPVVLTDG